MPSPIKDQTLETERARYIDIWKNAEVYISDDADPKVGMDGSFDPEVWKFVGLLNEGSAIGQEPEVDRTEIKSFGGVLQLMNNKFNKDSRTFDALEENEVTFGFMWPGSEFKRDEAGVLVTPENPAEQFIAFKTTNSFGDVWIDVSRRKALIYPAGARDRNDDGATVTTFQADVRKDDKGGLYDYLRLQGGDQVAEMPEVIRFGAAADEDGSDGDDVSDESSSESTGLGG